MNKISDAVRSLVLENPLLSFGFTRGLNNLSELARFIHPHVELKTKKEVQVSAITMALSRLQREVNSYRSAGEENFVVDDIRVHVDLCSLTLSRSPETLKSLNDLHTKIQKPGGYLTLTEGTREVTAILQSVHLDLALSILPEKPKLIYRNLASVGVTFDQRYIEVPAVLYLILQQVTVQNVNVIEVGSTATEFIIYVEDKDVKLTFDTIFSRFGRKAQLV